MGEKVKGVAPGFLLLPAREYEWELVRKVEIIIPNEGQLSALLSDKEVLTEVKLPGEDNFILYSHGVLLLWQIVQVLFAGIKYPDLKDAECLNVVALEIKDDAIHLYGEIIRSV